MSKTTRLHVVDDVSAPASAEGTRAKLLSSDRSSSVAAALMSDALGSYTASEFCAAAGVCRSIAYDWTVADGLHSPSLKHLARATLYGKPADKRVVAQLGKLLVQLAEPTHHIARALPDRVLDVTSEVGDVARAVREAWLDHRVTTDERAAMRKEIKEARAALDALERDIDAVTERE